MISNHTTTAVDPMPAPIPIVAELLSSSDPTVRQVFIMKYNIVVVCYFI